jgi:predicted nucleic acid-binding protein
MSAIIRDLKKNLPDEICIDTSFLLRYLVRIQPGIIRTTIDPAPYYNCIKNLTDNSVICYVSDFAIEEIYYKILNNHGKDAFDRYAGADRSEYKDWKEFCEYNPSYILGAFADIDQINKFLDSNLIFILPYTMADGRCIAELRQKSSDLITRYSLISRDAFIIAHSMYCGVNNFLTKDTHWKDVDGIFYCQM